MKPSRPWHFTPFGRLAFWLGGLELAVPVMILVAGGLAWGTYLDSAYGAKLAKARVYGSWWFLGLMALVCVSLVFAVVTRYPWKRRHVGFITVHAGLITLIAGGFWSLFGRVEGRLMLQEGTAAAAIETDAELLEVLELRAGQLLPVTSVAADSGAGRLHLEGVSLAIEERWANTREDTYVADDGSDPLRAVEIAFGDAGGEGVWVGEEARGGAATIHAVQVRVLAPGATWEPPAAPAPTPSGPGYAFMLAEQRFPLGAEGQEAVPGWTITSLKTFTSAVVGAGGMTENPSGPPNPAMEVVIADGKGTVERHTAFLNFPDMPMAKTIEGTARSGAQLRPVAAGGGESIVIHGDPPALRVAYVSADGGVQQHEFTGPPPWAFDAGRHRVTILRQFTRARVASRFVPAPPAGDRRPALLVRAGPGDPLVVPWKGMTPLPGFSAMVRYGPQTVPLPFSVRLDDFRKLDYPGTEMAMAYESDVTMTAAGREPRSQRIYMNNPLAHAGWKVYQSGFVGDNISIFSVMKDPGVPLTYAGCIAVVAGIIITFYSRAYSWGHPGIAVPFAHKEQADAALRTAGLPAAHAGGDNRSVPGGVDGPPGGDPDPGRGAGDAPGHLRPTPGGAADRAIPVVG